MGGAFGFDFALHACVCAAIPHLRLRLRCSCRLTRACLHSVASKTIPFRIVLLTSFFF